MNYSVKRSSYTKPMYNVQCAMKSRLFLLNGRDFIFCMHRLQGSEFFTAESAERSTGYQLFTAERTELHRFTGNRRLGFGGLTNWCGRRGSFFGKSDDRAVLFFVRPQHFFKAVLCAVINNSCQVVASIEYPVSDTRYAVGNRYRSQAFAPLEYSLSDTRYAVGNRYRGQACTRHK